MCALEDTTHYPPSPSPIIPHPSPTSRYFSSNIHHVLHALPALKPHPSIVTHHPSSVIDCEPLVDISSYTTIIHDQHNACPSTIIHVSISNNQPYRINPPSAIVRTSNIQQPAFSTHHCRPPYTRHHIFYVIKHTSYAVRHT